MKFARTNPVLTSWEGSRDPKEIEKALAKKDLGTSFLKKAGHASLVEGPDNRWFLLISAAEIFRECSTAPLGRETAIQEVVWEKGWLKTEGRRQCSKDSFRPSEIRMRREEEPLKKEYHFQDERLSGRFPDAPGFLPDLGMTIHERERVSKDLRPDSHFLPL